MIDFLLQPLRSAIRMAGYEAAKPLEDTEHDVLDAVHAVERVTESIDQHVQVIETLATSVGPLTESVNQLTATMGDLVQLLAPMGKAEHEMQHAGQDVERATRFLGFHRHKNASETEAGSVEP